MSDKFFQNFCESFICLPIIIGLIKIKQFDKGYRVFFFVLLTSLIYTASDSLVSSPVAVNTINYIYEFVIHILLLIYLSFWHKVELKKKHLWYTALLILILMIAESCFLGMSTYRVSIVVQLLDFIFLIFTLKVLSFVISQKTNKKEKTSKLLILVPQVCFYVFLLLIEILMTFLFNKSTMPFFIYLYKLINIINLLSYLSYSLSFLWAPSKEKYFMPL